MENFLCSLQQKEEEQVVAIDKANPWDYIKMIDQMENIDFLWIMEAYCSHCWKLNPSTNTNGEHKIVIFKESSTTWLKQAIMINTSYKSTRQSIVTIIVLI
jgi:hypothetical protein